MSKRSYGGNRFKTDKDDKDWTKQGAQLYPDRPVSSIPEQTQISERMAVVVEKSKFLDEFFRYSGYNLFPTSSAEAKKEGSKDTIVAESYAARFVKAEGSRSLFDEIVEPSYQLFPRELLKDLPYQPPAIHSAYNNLNLSSKALKRRTQIREDTSKEEDNVIRADDLEMGEEQDQDEAVTDSEDEDNEDGDYGTIYEDFDEDGVDDYTVDYDD